MYLFFMSHTLSIDPRALICRFYLWAATTGQSLDGLEGSNALYMYDRVWRDSLPVQVDCINILMPYWTLVDNGLWSKGLSLGPVRNNISPCCWLVTQDEDFIMFRCPDGLHVPTRCWAVVVIIWSECHFSSYFLD